MPLKFWKKEKAKEDEGEAEAKEEAPREPEKAKAPAREPEAAPASEAAAATKPEAPRGGIDGAHAGLVDLGLTIPATKGIFEKRIAAYPGGPEAFSRAFGSEPHKAVTQVLADWLALRARADFDPQRALSQINPRLSSFGLTIAMRDVAWLDEELGLRKCVLRLEERDKVVRFKDARDFLRGVNDLIASKKLAFIELETWSEDLAFLLVREPNWSALAETDLVVVKDHQTAADGECGECGARVGKYWNDCLACGAVFA